jgi:hypothetical protein
LAEEVLDPVRTDSTGTTKNGNSVRTKLCGLLNLRIGTVSSAYQRQSSRTKRTQARFRKEVERMSVPFTAGKAYDVQVDERAFGDYGKSSMTNLIYEDFLGGWLIFREIGLGPNWTTERKVYLKETWVGVVRENL